MEYTGNHHQVCEALDQLNLQSNQTIAAASRDFEAGYNQLPYEPNPEVKFALQYKSHYLVPRYVMFGHAPGGRYCQSVNEALTWLTAYRKTQKQNIPPKDKYLATKRYKSLFHGYVDDILTLGLNIKDANKNARLIDETAETIGIDLSKKKIVNAAHTWIWLGVYYDALDKTVQPTQERKGKLLHHALLYIEHTTISHKNMQSLQGILDSLAFLAWPLKIYTRELVETIKQNKPRYDTNDDLADMLYKFIHTIFTMEPTKWEIIYNQHQIINPISKNIVQDFNYVIDSDACTNAKRAGMGALNRTTGEWWYSKGDTSLHINILEFDAMTAMPYYYMKKFNMKGKKLLLRIDNTTVYHCIRNKYSRQPILNERVYEFLHNLSIRNNYVVAWWINTKENELADAISRNEINKAKSIAILQNAPMNQKPLF